MTVTQQDVVAREAHAVEGQAAPGTVESKRPLPLVPPVSIFEDSNQITVQADMPGVAKEGLDIHVDRNTLTIQGEVTIDMPAGMTPLYADLQTTRYQRSFALSGELDSERISASLKDGVLTVRIPKRIEYRARKIKVTIP
jgi:HSP20 family protein